MKTTAIVVTYDRLKHNRMIVESFRATAPADAELVVVDNGSSDETLDFLTEAAGDGRIDKLLLLPKNEFLGAAWNQALDEVRADSDWVGKIDNDAYFLEGWHDRLELAEAFPCGAVIIAPAFYDWRNIWHELKNRKRHESEVLGASMPGGELLYKPGDFGGCYFIRKRYLDGGLRMKEFRRMTLDTNKRLLDGVRKRGGKVLRLARPGISWDKVRLTDPDLADYYEKTFRARGILHKLRARQKRERAKIKSGEMSADA